MTDLFPDGDFTFLEGGDPHYEKGKVHHPALLRLRMSKGAAFRTIRTLLFFLESDDIEQAEITFVGAIERHDEDGNRIAMDGSALEEADNAGQE